MTSRIIELPSQAEAAKGAKTLLSAAAVRAAAQRMLMLGLDGRLDDWRVDLEALPGAADYVARIVREQYPHLNPPIHARWRHFVIGGHDLWQELLAQHRGMNVVATARAAFDLVLTSVLLDAGAGPGWRYRDAVTGLTLARSEGLALASFRWFESGALSDDRNDPLRVDAAALMRVDARSIQNAFQVTAHNPLLGTEGRASLLNRLGSAVVAQPEIFGLADKARPGGFFDACRRLSEDNRVPATEILRSLLLALGGMWEHRPSLSGVALGDCWPHPAFSGNTPEDGFVPLHKLSQWLTYSLLEPLAAAGVTVTDIEALTGLPEYRNGGLFVDLGVLIPRADDAASRTYAVSDGFVVGWRAMTVALLDQIAPMVGERLGLGAVQFPLAKVLEGGTWAAGRSIARERRSDGGPPFKILSDGTVF